MGKIYKRKRRSCPLCKPHKTGGSDKMKPRQRDKLVQDEIDMRNAALPGGPDRYIEYDD